ncbi:autoinducer-2 kinase [Oribacterium sp. C9]|uniref:autoinducer-2 kinase n=1 Tax=Oribacterium sp. C9 TaxID=1943579 RepID=UPI00098EB9E8|nr:autoinducer-2 kinase [Oribacterium sp. C9]OON85062.1 autoinducer-2 kinase [Oribacterium sp. C9]
MGKYLMAIDAGTGSIRAVIFDLDGNQISCCQHEWDHIEDPKYPGSMNFDWVNGWVLAKQCIEGATKDAGIDSSEIAAISTTCMREGIVLYDASGQEIWACANVDARSTDEVVELIRSYPGLEKELYLESGQSFALDALPRLLWVKNKLPDIYEKVAKIGMFNDWLIYKLTGSMIVEPSNGSTSGLMDLRTRNWDPSILERCGLKTDIFPEVRESGTIAGEVSENAASETGLTAGTKVVVGGGDAQLGCIGVGVVDPNEAAIFGGSFWQYEYNTGEAKTDPQCRVRVNCHAVPNVWQYEALAFKPGLVMRWFRDGFCQLEKKLSEETGRDPYDIMNEEAAKIPAGCYGMMCTFSDVMNFISWKHAAPTFTNFELDPERFSRYTFYRAILENTALVTRGHMDLVRESTGNMPSEVLFASGASKSPLWSQILADVLGIPVKVPSVKEATALGAAIIAGYGVGLYSDISETSKRLVHIAATYEPNMENHKVYNEMYESWRKVYATQLDLANSGLTRHMWAAPGV